jgi:molybdopterin-containing oxidoreductase family iron-sulfur binding subunit
MSELDLELKSADGGMHALHRDAASDRFWRSLEELSATDEFSRFIEREFPSQVWMWDDPVGRRRFLQLMAASLGLAGAVGCGRTPREEIVPYVRESEEVIPGESLYFATAMPRRRDSLGLLVESHMGRPIKIEGNPEHPSSRGATDAIAQASILSLYDPDRSQTVMHRGFIATWDSFRATVKAEIDRLRKREGAGLRILTESVTSPTLAAQLDDLLQRLPQAGWYQFEPLHADHARSGARLAFGRDVDTVYRFDAADVILSLDADFLLEMPGHVRYARDLMSRRRGTGLFVSQMNRLYVLESTPTITGATADHRMALSPPDIGRFALALASRLGVPGVPSTSAQAAVPREWLSAIASDLESHRGRSIILAGDGQPAHIHELANRMNGALGNVAATVTYIEPLLVGQEGHVKSLTKLVAEMLDKQVETLIIIAGNPVYASAESIGFSAALQKVPLSIRWSEYYDETSRACTWHLPATHFLESWSDTRAYDGTASIVQPLIAPLYEGRTAHELMALLLDDRRSSFDIVREYWQKRLTTDDFGIVWRRALHDGLIPGTAANAVDVSPQKSTHNFGSVNVPGDREALTIQFRSDPTIEDGRYANNGWLQELPKPLTKLTWDNVAMMSVGMARTLGVENGDVAEVRIGNASLEAPVWVMPGQADKTVSLTLGYGRVRAGLVGSGIGYNAFRILPADGSWFATGTVRPVGRRVSLATTQNHHSMEGRDIVRVAAASQVEQGAEHLFDGEHPTDLPSLYPEIIYADQPNSWGMSIDQTACIGCNACVIACQAENNIPIVGKEEVMVGREMHWLRIDRYFHGDPEQPESYFQPMMCVHCEQAPCEVVCPVAATVHDAEGTNNMIYNRCIGTRYCSNNCPYKVRRFNFLEYADQTTEILKLLRNPEVTVRTRGVMEKCTYCIQRISAARIKAKRENRPIADGEVVTACQQACPTEAIVFGNLNDPQSRLVQLKKSPLDYGVLAELNTKPRTTYLPRIVNSHPSLPPPSAASEAGHGESHSPDTVRA